MDFTSTKVSLFSKALDRVRNKLSCWQVPLLPFASRVILARHVLLTIPSYLLSVFKAPVYFLIKLSPWCSIFFGTGKKKRGWFGGNEVFVAYLRVKKGWACGIWVVLIRLCWAK